MSRPKVSVIVPAFDAERDLREALYSVARQRLTDHEVIVIDDGSTTDACEQIVAATRKDTGHRMRYLRQDNRGPAVARNCGLAEAKGELIAFLDSDDVYEPDKLALQVEIMRCVSPDYAFVTGGFERFVEGAPAETRVVFPAPLEGKIYPTLLYSGRAIPWAPAAHLFRRAALVAAGGYDAALRYGEDKELVIRLARTSKVLTHRDVVFRYRIHARSLSVSLGEPRLLADVDYLVRSLCAADPRLPRRLIRQMRRETLLSAAALALHHTGSHARFTALVRAAVRTGGVGSSWRSWRTVGRRVRRAGDEEAAPPCGRLLRMAGGPNGRARGGGAPLNLAIVGCGRVVERYHLPALARTPQWNLVSACDPLAERREWIAGQRERVAVFETLSELVDACRPDAALVATPPSAHREAVVRALEAGIHVLVEKPMALTAADAARMWQTSLQTQTRLAVGFSRRFQRSYLELRERFALLAPREVELIRFDLAGNAAAWKAVTDFLGDDRRGGGPLDDLASHQLDFLLWLVRQRVTRVRARPPAVAEAHSQRIEFELEFETGLIAECGVGHGPRREESIRILLRDRQIILDGDRLFELRRRSAAWMRAYLPVRRLRDRLAGRRQAAEDGVTPFARQLCSFAQFCRSPGEGEAPPSESRANGSTGGALARGADAIADGMSGLRTVRVVEACRESLRAGGSWVSVESWAETGGGGR